MVKALRLLFSLLLITAFCLPVNAQINAIANDSPIYVKRIEQSKAFMSTIPNVKGDEESVHNGDVTIMTPASVGASLCLGSICFGSGCAGSICFGSGCAGSICFGSGCVTSGCAGSGCLSSGCVGSACLQSGCVASVCIGSTCVGTVCTGSTCVNCN